jgi:hypothetical protein
VGSVVVALAVPDVRRLERRVDPGPVVPEPAL